MTELDGKVKAILDRLSTLILRKILCPSPILDIEINTLIGALKMIEGKSNG